MSFVSLATTRDPIENMGDKELVTDGGSFACDSSDDGDDATYDSYSYCTDPDQDLGLGGFTVRGLGIDDAPSIFNSDPVRCPICFSVADSGEGLTLPGCFHSFCVGCFKSYVAVQMGNGNASNIRCPMPLDECGAPVDQMVLKDMLDEETQEKLQYCQETSFVMKNPDYHHCPTPDCTNIVYWKTGPPIADCFQCARTTCLKCCASPFHNGKTCEEWKKEEEKRRRLQSTIFRCEPDRSRAGEEARYDFKPTDDVLASMKIRVCRRCGSGVEHQSGCLKMKCLCGYRFCFDCGSENAQCDCTPARHGFIDNTTGIGDFAGLRDSKSYT